MNKIKWIKYNKNYAIYDEEDRFIEGFDNLYELCEYLQCTIRNIHYSFERFQAKGENTEVFRHLIDSKENIYECSKQLFEFLYDNKRENKVKKGSKIYAFWIEKPEKYE